MTENNKKALYESIMEKVSQQVVEMLNEGIENDKERLANILNNWDKLPLEAKNILASSLDKIANIGKEEGENQEHKQTATKPQTTNNDEKPLFVPNERMLTKYLNSGNVSKELKEYVKKEIVDLNKLLDNIKTLGIMKNTTDLRKESEVIIRNTLSVKNKFNELKFNELFTVHTSTSFGDINLLTRSKICKPIQEAIYEMVLNFNFVRVMLEYVKSCIKQNFESNNCSFIQQYGYEKNDFRKLIEDKLNLSQEEKLSLLRVHNGIAHIWGASLRIDDSVIKDIKYIDIIILLRICMVNAYYVYKMKLMTT